MDYGNVINKILTGSISRYEMKVKLDLYGIKMNDFINNIKIEHVLNSLLHLRLLMDSMGTSEKRECQHYFNFLMFMIKQGFFDKHMFVLIQELLTIGNSIKSEENITLTLKLLKCASQRRNKIVKNKKLIV